MAGRCSAALVEPPVQPTTAPAFSSDLRVTTSRARMFFSIRLITATPEDSQYWSRLS
jgi:hypothetical protein